MTTVPNPHHPVDFHADLSFFGVGADRIEIDHIDVEHPRKYGERARICAITMVTGAVDDQLLEFDERTAVSFCQAILAGFDHPDVPSHREAPCVSGAELVEIVDRLWGASPTHADDLVSALLDEGYKIVRT